MKVVALCPELTPTIVARNWTPAVESGHTCGPGRLSLGKLLDVSVHNPGQVWVPTWALLCLCLGVL